MSCRLSSCVLASYLDLYQKESSPMLHVNHRYGFIPSNGT